MSKILKQPSAGAKGPERKSAMKKRLLVLGLALLLAVVWTSLVSAAELTLGGGIVYQLGSYGFTFSNGDEEAPYDCSASAPPLRYELSLAYGRWNLNGFLTKQILGHGTVDEDLVELEENLAYYGGVTAFGGDVAYLFDIGSFKLGPSIGYRSTQVISGVKSSDETGFGAEGIGFQTRGLRLGAYTEAALGDRFSFGASLGCSPRLGVAEISEGRFSDTEDHMHGYYSQVHEIPAPSKAFSFDLAVTASVRVMPAIEIVGGYRYEHASIELDPESSSHNVSAYTMNASVLSVGARYRF